MVKREIPMGFLLLGVQSVQPPVSPPPYIRAAHAPNFATSIAKLVYKASRKGCSTWPGLKPRPTLNLELRA